MTIYIKNMVCLRCKLAVQGVLEKLNIEFLSIELGKVKLATDLNVAETEKLNAELKLLELELINDKKKVIVERVKNLILEYFHSTDDININLSAYLSKALGHDYNYISNVFSEEEGSTIERFFIEKRIERVKEMIVYESLNVTEIAYRLNYSSVSHLCQQFKKVTGFTPSIFKKLCATEDFVWRKV